MKSWLRQAANALISATVVIPSIMIPRTNTVWVVGGNRGLKYGDNAMYFLKYCSRFTNKRLVWLARSKSVLAQVRADGYEAHHIGSIKGIWLGLRAYWHVFDVSADTDTGPTSRGAHLLNLWHGIPIKDIRFLKRKKRTGPLFDLARLILLGRGRLSRSFFIHPSRTHIQHILESFELSKENVIYANLPRAIAFDVASAGKWYKSSDLVAIERVKKDTNGAHVLGYFPTWRGNDDDLFLGTLEGSTIDSINSFLKEKNCFLLTKWHDCVYPVYKHYGASSKVNDLLQILRKQSNIIVLGFDADLNSFLPLCEGLITDYSSVLFDYLLTDRQSFFFACDLDDYRERWGLLFDYETFVPGPVLRDLPSLMAEISIWSENPASYAESFCEARRAIRGSFFEHIGGPEWIVGEMDRIARVTS